MVFHCKLPATCAECAAAHVASAKEQDMLSWMSGSKLTASQCVHSIFSTHFMFRRVSVQFPRSVQHTLSQACIAVQGKDRALPREALFLLFGPVPLVTGSSNSQDYRGSSVNMPAATRFPMPLKTGPALWWARALAFACQGSGRSM